MSNIKPSDIYKRFPSIQKGKFFKAEFYKRDGTRRVMTCRKAYKVREGAGMNNENRYPDHLMSVIEIPRGERGYFQKSQYRTVSTDRLIAINGVKAEDIKQ